MYVRISDKTKFNAQDYVINKIDYISIATSSEQFKNKIRGRFLFQNGSRFRAILVLYKHKLSL